MIEKHLKKWHLKKKPKEEDYAKEYWKEVMDNWLLEELFLDDVIKEIKNIK